MQRRPPNTFHSAASGVSVQEGGRYIVKSNDSEIRGRKPGASTGSKGRNVPRLRRSGFDGYGLPALPGGASFCRAYGACERRGAVRI
jgi:hypothetical protein